MVDASKNTATGRYMPLERFGLTFNAASVVLFLFSLLLLVNAISAYTVRNLPIQWLSQVSFIATIILLGFTTGLYRVPETILFWWLFLWLLLVTFLNLFLENVAQIMPAYASTPYIAFISLRFINLLSFISVVYLVYWLLINGYKDSVVKWTVIIGSIISLAAVYIYFAQVYGLPEPPRNRLGTGGGEQATTFTYAFHRASGTFREPSLLAEWLVVPFFLSLIYRRGKPNIHTIIIGTTILLTGSLTGIIGAFLGVVGAFFVNRSFSSIGMKSLLYLGLILLFILLIFSVIAVSYEKKTANIIKVIVDRMVPIAEGGVEQSNRAFVYEYISDNKPMVLGVGLGNSNIVFTDYMNSDNVVSFSSLYVNILYSGGIFGIILLIIFLAGPLIGVLKTRYFRDRPEFLFLLAAYIAWLVMFAITQEEFSVMFAISFAFLVFELRSAATMKKGI